MVLPEGVQVARPATLHSLEEWEPAAPRPARRRRGFTADCLLRTQSLSYAQVEGAMETREIVSILEREQVAYVVVGAYGISGWLREPRATEDVDVLIAHRHHRRTVAAMRRAFPELTVRDTPVVTRFFSGEQAVLDLMKPHHALFQAALKNTTLARVGHVTLRVPVLEVALALKFASMTGLRRQLKDKYQDAHDFIGMVQNNRKIELSQLRDFGELAYPGGGGDLVKMVEDARAGKRLEL